MKIEDLKKEFKNEWLIIKVTKAVNGKAIEGELLDHCKDRKEIWERVKKVKTKGIYITFAGPPLEEGHAAAFSTIDIDSKAPLIILQADLGKDKLRIDMALDTGATYVMLPWYVVEYLDCDVISAKRIPIITASGIEIVPLINIDVMTVLDAQVRNVPAVCHDMPPQSAIEGLLGLSFLRNFRILIDFKNERLTID